MAILTDEKKFKNQEAFIALATKVVPDMDAFTNYLIKADYFNAPYTTKYVGAYAGGLCEHALALYNELAMLCNAYHPNKYSEEDIIKVALFKDIYKAELYEKYNRNVKNEETGKWEARLEYRVKDIRPTFGTLGFSSYMIAKYFTELNDEHIEAIVHASLGMEDGFKTADIYDIMQSYQLVLLTHMAELAASYIGDKN